MRTQSQREQELNEAIERALDDPAATGEAMRLASTVGRMRAARVVEKPRPVFEKERRAKSPKAYKHLDADDVRTFILKGWRVRSASHNVHILPR